MKKILLICLCFVSSVSLASTIDVGFSTDKTALPLVLKAINSSKTSICMATYSFTSKPISQALLEAKNRSVNIKVVSDWKGNKGKYSAVTFLANHGVNVKLNSHYSIMHNKFIVIDDSSVETGSFNYSAGAVNKNAENVIVIWDDKSVARKYQVECDRLYNQSTIQLKANY
ncbi:MAG: phospholipase D family protein [Burkholderiales bacterium]|nr:phospholipase D family protein [Burkholderiales bacterium]